jgi:RNA polymerase sigma factor (sigma-70 family)
MPENFSILGDEELAAKVARRAESVQAKEAADAAMEILCLRYAEKLGAYLAARVNPRDQAEDVQQTVWAHVLSHLDHFDGRNFRAWLFKIAHNAMIDSIRGMRLQLVEDLDNRPDSRGQSPESVLARQELKEALERCMKTLEAERAGVAALVRARLAGWSYAEISRELKLAPDRAQQMYHRAKKQLQNCVERELS